jgi:Carboxypeptidase regulatory-like domain
LKTLTTIAAIAFLEIGCGEARMPTQPSSGTSGATSPAAPYTLSGTVFESTATGAQPVAGAQLRVSIEDSPAPGHFRYYAFGAVTADAQGRYEVTPLPAGLVWLDAAWSPAVRGIEQDSYVQPCAAAVRVQRDTTFDVELLRAGAGQSPRMIRPFTISGNVFETTPDGRLPVAGVRIFAEKVIDFVATGAVSDAQGRYLLCGLPADAWSVVAVADGYQLWSSAYTPLVSDRQVDIELLRR